MEFFSLNRTWFSLYVGISLLLFILLSLSPGRIAVSFLCFYNGSGKRIYRDLSFTRASSWPCVYLYSIECRITDSCWKALSIKYMYKKMSIKLFISASVCLFAFLNVSDVYFLLIKKLFFKYEIKSGIIESNRRVWQNRRLTSLAFMQNENCIQLVMSIIAKLAAFFN